MVSRMICIALALVSVQVFASAADCESDGSCGAENAGLTLLQLKNPSQRVEALTKTAVHDESEVEEPKAELALLDQILLGKETDSHEDKDEDEDEDQEEEHDDEEEEKHSDEDDESSADKAEHHAAEVLLALQDERLDDAKYHSDKAEHYTAEALAEAEAKTEDAQDEHDEQEDEDEEDEEETQHAESSLLQKNSARNGNYGFQSEREESQYRRSLQWAGIEDPAEDVNGPELTEEEMQLMDEYKDENILAGEDEEETEYNAALNDAVLNAEEHKDEHEEHEDEDDEEHEAHENAEDEHDEHEDEDEEGEEETEHAEDEHDEHEDEDEEDEGEEEDDEALKAEVMREAFKILNGDFGKGEDFAEAGTEGAEDKHDEQVDEDKEDEAETEHAEDEHDEQKDQDEEDDESSADKAEHHAAEVLLALQDERLDDAKYHSDEAEHYTAEALAEAEAKYPGLLEAKTEHAEDEHDEHEDEDEEDEGEEKDDEALKEGVA